MAALEAFERDAGKHMAIVHFYWGWPGERPLDIKLLERIAAHGSIPMITWESWDWQDPPGAKQQTYRLANIVNGKFDRYIRSWARQLASYGGPILLRWGHEMNGDWYPWGNGVNGNTPAEFVQAWKRLHDIFAKEGATNVAWVWCPNVDWADPALFFPGDDYVDWIGLDGYNNTEEDHRTFAEVFTRSYQRVTALSDKPLMIAETSSAEGIGDKTAWIRDALIDQIPHNFPRVRALIWFNEDFQGDDFRIQSSPSARAAFAAAIASSVYASEWQE